MHFLARRSAWIAASLFTVLSPARAQTSFTVGNTTINVEDVVTGLEVPWDMVLGPDGWIWFTEAAGRISRVHPDDGTVQLIHTLPDVHEFGFTAGLHSMAFHPDFAEQPYVYVHYTISTTESVVRQLRYDADLNILTEPSEHLLSLTLAAGPSHNGSRIIVDEQGMFLLCIGETMSASASAQDPNTSHGKVLRFDPDGGIPEDNPVAGSYVYNWGHRNPQGLVRAANGHIYNSAHGQGNDDEVNIILPNRNYGWPTVLGLCNTSAEIAYCEANDVVEPIHEFTAEVVAPAGIDYFDHPAIPEWQNSLLVATLKGKELHQLQLDATGDAVTSDLSYLQNTHGRLRDVLVHPDGRIFVCTSNHDWAGTPGPNDDRIIVLVSENIVTGISQRSAGHVRAWPNPATDMVRIEGLAAEAYDLRLIDATGKPVLEQRTTRPLLDVSGVAPGTYVLRVQGTGAVHALRITVQ